MPKTYKPDPQDKDLYGFDFTPWLEGDTLTSSSWTMDPDDGTLIKSSPSFDPDGQTSIYLTGGIPGTEYKLTNHVVSTPRGREKDVAFFVVPKEV